MQPLSTKQRPDTGETQRNDTVIIIGAGATEPTIISASSGHFGYKPKKSISLKEFAAAGGFDGIPRSAEKAEPVYTSSQSSALERLSDRAEAYFSGLGRELPFVPRFNSLLLAPTGSGKTKIARDLAKRMGAEFFVVAISEWIVRGAQNEKSTISALVRVLKRSPRTVLLLDEIDKFVSQTDCAWTRSLAAEIWALLDRRLPSGGEPSAESGQDEEHEDLQKRLTNGLYIVGAGTFQHAWDQSARPRCGFNADDSHATTDHGIMEAIEKSGWVSPELLSRFSPAPILLRYPSRSEVQDLLERMGLNRLASETGVTIDLDSIRVEKCGMRAIEQLGAELLIGKAQQGKRIQAELLKAKTVSRTGTRSISKP
jgi:SpoVK/Ycf46/Vps4 family AAA+-type ATPase